MAQHLEFKWTCPTTDNVQDKIKEYLEDEYLEIPQKIKYCIEEVERLRALFSEMRVAADEQLTAQYESLMSDYYEMENERDALENKLEELNNN